MIYQFKDGAHAPAGADPQATGEALQSLQEAHRGNLTAADIVPRRKEPIFRDWFTEDRDEAAEKCWLEEARHMIRSLVVMYEGSKGEPRTVRAFWNVVISDEGQERE